MEQFQLAKHRQLGKSSEQTTTSTNEQLDFSRRKEARQSFKAVDSRSPHPSGGIFSDLSNSFCILEESFEYAQL